jgi:hypothetical protein
MIWRNVVFIAACFSMAVMLLASFIRMTVTGSPVWIWEPNLFIRGVEIFMFAAWTGLCVERLIWLLHYIRAEQ